MEEEEREAQSAKLQELIRRGAPADLQEANRLMKVMAGFDTRTKTDYRAKAAEEVAKIQAKARLLEERLASFGAADSDVLEDLAAALQSAQPKIQKMCEEESEDHEAVAKLLEINDSIHRTAERYRLLKKGDVEGAAKIAQGMSLPAGGPPVGSGAAGGELSLIDFDADAETGNKAGTTPSGSSQPAQPGGLENDLLGLSIGDPVPMSYGQAGSISLGFGTNDSKFRVRERSPTKANRLTDVPGPSLFSPATQNNNNAKSPSPGFSSFISPPTSSSATPQPAQSTYTPPPPSYKPAADPFASLIGISPSATPAQASAQAPPPKPAASAEDDEWAFSSALPSEVPQEHSSTVCNTGLTITLNASRKHGPNAMVLFFQFTNNTSEEFTELHYQLAAPKASSPESTGLGADSNANTTQGYELQLNPQTGRTLAPHKAGGITQTVAAWHAGARERRWRLSS
ncbi:hypothetical protein IMZ48_34475 [Candidatus Bathyarchaeota archaeon]|nr:hypothetical protein [Candidatus Bathyarchaeota archaeon]